MGRSLDRSRETRRLIGGYIRTLLGVMGWRVGLALALALGVSLTEGLGLLLLVPMLGLVGLDVQQGATGRVSSLAGSAFAAVGIRPSLVLGIAACILLVALRAVLQRYQTTTRVALGYEFALRLRERLYRSIVGASWLYLSKRRASDFSHALIAEVDRVEYATHLLLGLAVDVVLALVYLGFALQVSGLVTGLVLAGGGLLLFVLQRQIRVAQARGEAISAAMSNLYAAAQEHLTGLKAVKSYRRESSNARIFRGLAEEVRGVYLGAVDNQAQVKLWFDLGSALVLGLVLYVLLDRLAVPVSEVLVLLFVFVRVMPRLSGLQQSYQSFLSQLPAFATVSELRARCEAAAEPFSSEPATVELAHEISLEGVSFSYEPNADEARDSLVASDFPSPEAYHPYPSDPGEDEGAADYLALRDLDLTIRAGETTAIVGPSGAGKSTIADLLLGLIVPDEGRVLVDGRPLGAKIMASWRDQIGYVAQDVFLLNDTVRANLLWASPSATDDEIWNSLHLAAAEGFVSRLPDGLETKLGDRGVRLSGGERQRLALARALLRRPRLLILDEATSSLDSENERRIQEAIQGLQGKMTIVVIAHRLATVRSADVIHVLEGGRLVESGGWDELLGREDGRFASLVRAQGLDAQPEQLPSSA